MHLKLIFPSFATKFQLKIEFLFTKCNAATNTHTEWNRRRENALPSWRVHSLTECSFFSYRLWLLWLVGWKVSVSFSLFALFVHWFSSIFFPALWTNSCVFELRTELKWDKKVPVFLHINSRNMFWAIEMAHKKSATTIVTTTNHQVERVCTLHAHDK